VRDGTGELKEALLLAFLLEKLYNIFILPCNEGT
jgi:hypothetical protein